MLTTAFVMSILITAGFVILFYKLPPRVRQFLSKRYILMDVLLCAAVFSSLGFALIGLMAAGFISLFVSAYLWWYKQFGYRYDDMHIKQRRRCKRSVRIAAKLYNKFRKEKNDVQTITAST